MFEAGHPDPALKKFQDFLQVSAVRLVEEMAGYRLLSNRDNPLLVAPAARRLAQLP